MFDYVHAKGLSIHDGHVSEMYCFSSFSTSLGDYLFPCYICPFSLNRIFTAKTETNKKPHKTKNQERVKVKLLTFNIYFSELTEYNSLQNKTVQGEGGFLGS